MLTEKDYCDYDTCVALKELGYNQYTSLRSYAGKGGVRLWDFDGEPNYKEGELIALNDMYGIPSDGNEVAAPSLYEAQKFMREEKEVYVTVIPEYNEFGPIKGVKYRLEVAYWKDDEFGYETIEWLDEECPHTIITFDSYEEALSEGVKCAVKLLKEK
jgi:hypothetical protein